MALREKILIVGFSGSGKSTLIEGLKQRGLLGWELADLDDLIGKAHGKGQKDLNQLILEQGWEQFRAWEKERLDQWIQSPGRGVLSLGGGAMREDLLNHHICYLEASFETCWKRIKEDVIHERPLAKKGEAFMRDLYQERIALFQKAPYKISVDGKKAEEVVEDFLKIALPIIGPSHS